MADNDGVTRLGGVEEGHVQRYFCINEPEKAELPRLSREAKIIKKTPKTICVKGNEVQGWIVEILTPSTDGIVRIDPQEERGIILTEARH
jgi:hypothetical protein